MTDCTSTTMTPATNSTRSWRCLRSATCGELRGVIVTEYEGYGTTGWMALPFFAIALEMGQAIEAEAVWCPRCDSGVLDMIDGGVEVLELFANEKISMDDIKRILGEEDD